jgi:hypothetical protein
MSEFVGQGQDSPVSPDGDVHDRMQSLVAEAAERATFHRVELERWMRVGRAAAAAVNQLQQAEPISQTTVEDFYGRDQVAKQAYAPVAG